MSTPVSSSLMIVGVVLTGRYAAGKAFGRTCCTLCLELHFKRADEVDIL